MTNTQVSHDTCVTLGLVSYHFLYQPSPAAQSRLGVPVERIRHRKRGGTIDTGPRGRSERPLSPTVRSHYKSRCLNIQNPMNGVCIFCGEIRQSPSFRYSAAHDTFFPPLRPNRDFAGSFHETVVNAGVSRDVQKRKNP